MIVDSETTKINQLSNATIVTYWDSEKIYRLKKEQIHKIPIRPITQKKNLIL